MNQRDQDLLEKQLAWLRPAPRYGSLKVAVTVATLLVGLGIGGTVVLRDPNSTEVAASTGTPLAVPTVYFADAR
jgi:hypothetical protein